MSIRIEQISPIQFQAATSSVQTKETEKSQKKSVSSKVVLGALAATGVTALAILAIKNKKKPNISKVERIIGKNPNTQTLTEIEKEKLIKELQSQTDNPEVKEAIRKLIENGEWDKL